MKWTRDTLLTARRQGWTVMEHGDTRKLMIAKVDDDPDDDGSLADRFEFDEDALAFVSKLATEGDALAQAALDYVG